MKKRGTNSFSVQLLLGIIFTVIGLPFLALGIYFAIRLPWIIEYAEVNGDPRILPFVFILVGGIFSAIGLAFLIWIIGKKKNIRKVIQGGYSVNAVISEVSINYNLEINGRNPYMIVCQYQDPQTAILHIFKSGNIMFFPGDLTGRMIRVFVEPGNFNHYYVDVDSVLPQVEMH